jgi:preprotein translocase subunit YajC
LSFLATLRFSATLVLMVSSFVSIQAQQTPATSSGSAPLAKAVGTIKSVQTDSIIVSLESGGEVTAKLAASTKILRVPPGEKDLMKATAVQLQDLQPGDRVLVRGTASDNSGTHTISALAVIVMKQEDVAAKQQHDRDDWQKRGVGGLVTKVDAPGNTITISSGGLSSNHTITVHVAKLTILRRYPPGSVKFDDAKPSPIDEIKAGDQLRARGTRNADGTELTADEVVSGSFRNIAGTIKSIDAANNTITVHDAIAKAPVVVKISADSQMKKLPAEMAQRIATRLKSTAAGTGDQSAATGQAQSQAGQGQTQGQSHPPTSTLGAAGAQSEAASQSGRGQGRGGQGGNGAGSNGPPDLQRMLSHLPNSKLADLQKGDAVMIVSSESGNSDSVTAITLLAGVDAILTAAPSRSASLLSPWSLSTGGGEGEGAQ